MGTYKLIEFHFSLAVYIEHLLGRKGLHVTIIFFACMTGEMALVFCANHVLQTVSERYILLCTGCLQHFQNYNYLMFSVLLNNVKYSY